MSKATEQLAKSEPARPPRAIPEEDLVRIWSVKHGETPTHTVCAQEVAAWESHIRAKGWIPKVDFIGTQVALYICAHAFPRDPHLEERVSAIEQAVHALSRNQNALGEALDRLASRRIVAPS
jgi:hypothetical protein